ncbi:MAG: nitroreductase family protein [Chloroflexota bacterium]
MGVYQLAIRRRTIRRFQDRKVPAEVLDKCLNAARLAASAANLQPLEYIVVDDEAMLEQIFPALQWAVYIRPAGIPPEGKRPRAYIFIIQNQELSRPASVHDVGIAAAYMMLVALDEGIGSCPIVGMDRQILQPLLKVPTNYEIPMVLALGYPDESPVAEPFTGSVQYWKDDKGVLHVPKRGLEGLRHHNTF